jgi:N-acetylglucosamine kinase-like BadF-type ATPase
VSKPARVIQDAVDAALSQSPFTSIDALVVGAAGAGDPRVRKELHTILTRTKAGRTIHIVSDAELQLEAAYPGGPGIMLSAGTGSIALARDRYGKLHRVGGHGFRFGDEGSGYAIGRDAIQATLAATEGRGQETMLLALLCLETNVQDAEAFAGWTRTATRQSVADVAPVVMLAAQAGDRVARHIVAEAAANLTAHVKALAHHVIRDKTIRIALGGGLLTSDTPLRRQTIRQLRLSFSRLDVFEGLIDELEGALHLARRVTGA